MISIIIPVFNEEQSLNELHSRILECLKGKMEIIFVDDGSTDSSLKIIENLAGKDKRVKFVSLGKNFGKSKALMAGIKNSKGEILVTIDADLQDDPAEIPRLLNKIRKGYDLVVGWKKKRKDSLGIIIASRIFNCFVSRLSGVKLHDINCGLKVLTKETAESFNLYGDLYRFIPILAANKGFKVTEVEIKHFPRRYGRSKYGVSKLYRGFFDFFTVLFLTKFKTRPLHFFGFLGSSLFFTGVLICSYLTILWFQGESIGRRPLLILGILLIIVGIQLFSTGLLAELIVSNIYKETEK